VGKEKRYCYGISMGPNGGKFGDLIAQCGYKFYDGPDSAGVEMITREQRLLISANTKRKGCAIQYGLSQTPFIGGICNCDRADCLAMRCTVTHGIPVMFRAELYREADPDRCAGCRQCMKLCQFGGQFPTAHQIKNCH